MSAPTFPPIPARLLAQAQEDYRGRRVLAIYDFVGLGYSFDISIFLVYAEVERRRRGCEAIDVAFVCHATDPSSPATPFVTENSFRHYVHNIGLELTRLLPSIGSVFVFDNRALFSSFLDRFEGDYAVLPEGYRSLLATNPACGWLYPQVISWTRAIEAAASSDPTLLCLTAPDEQVKAARKWLLRRVHPRIPVTITLRECDFRAAVNSQLEQWQRLVESYRGEEITFVVLRDYYKLYEEPPLRGENVIEYNEPLAALSLRAALYQECTLNLFVPNGCSALAMFNQKARYLYFTRLCAGITPGDRYPGASEFQRIVYAADDFPTLREHLDAMLSALARAKALEPSFYRAPADPHGASRTASPAALSELEKYHRLFTPQYLRRRIPPLVDGWVASGRRVLIYGAGYHTDQLYHWTNLSTATIVGVADSDAAKRGELRHGHPVISPDEIPALEPDVVLISSNTYQEQIYESLRPLEANGVELVRIYREVDL